MRWVLANSVAYTTISDMLIIELVMFACGLFCIWLYRSDRSSRKQVFGGAGTLGTGMLFFVCACTLMITSLSISNIGRKVTRQIPVYPGAIFSTALGGKYLFETTDQPESVVAYYEALASSGGCKLLRQNDDLIVTPTNGRAFKVMFEPDVHYTTIVYSYENRPM